MVATAMMGSSEYISAVTTGGRSVSGIFVAMETHTEKRLQHEVQEAFHYKVLF